MNGTDTSSGSPAEAAMRSFEPLAGADTSAVRLREVMLECGGRLEMRLETGAGTTIRLCFRTAIE